MSNQIRKPLYQRSSCPLNGSLFARHLPRVWLIHASRQRHFQLTKNPVDFGTTQWEISGQTERKKKRLATQRWLGERRLLVEGRVILLDNMFLSSAVEHQEALLRNTRGFLAASWFHDQKLSHAFVAKYYCSYCIWFSRYLWISRKCRLED